MSNPEDAPQASTSSSYILLCRDDQTMCHSHAVLHGGVLANDAQVVPTSQIGPVSQMVCHHAWIPGRTTGLIEHGGPDKMTDWTVSHVGQTRWATGILG